MESLPRTNVPPHQQDQAIPLGKANPELPREPIVKGDNGVLIRAFAVSHRDIRVRGLGVVVGEELDAGHGVARVKGAVVTVAAEITDMAAAEVQGLGRGANCPVVLLFGGMERQSN